jgi:predicted SAM-dependent methyltransferase
MQQSLRAWLKARTPDTARRKLLRVEAKLKEARIRIIRLIAPPCLPQNPEGKVYLNIGSGHVTHPSFINVDALVARHIHFIRPVDDLRPFPDDSVDLAYVSHCLEHFGHSKVNEVLAEWRRILKPGGVLRIGVPDFDQLIALYEASGRDMEAIQVVLMGGQTYPLNAHYTAFTRKSLTDRLRVVGFTQVRHWERNTDELTSLPDFTGLEATVGGRTIVLSLNLEAVK